MQVINSLLSQMVNTPAGEKFKIGSNETAKMDVYDFKNFVKSNIKNNKIEFGKPSQSKDTFLRKRKCIILILKKKEKT